MWPEYFVFLVSTNLRTIPFKSCEEYVDPLPFDSCKVSTTSSLLPKTNVPMGTFIIYVPPEMEGHIFLGQPSLKKHNVDPLF